MSTRLKAKGDDRVPEADRFYLEVEYPSVTENGARPKISHQCFWFNKKWTIGRILDIVCDAAGIENRNHIPSAKHLHLISRRNDAIFPSDIPLALLEPALMSGDSVSLTYQ